MIVNSKKYAVKRLRGQKAKRLKGFTFLPLYLFTFLPLLITTCSSIPQKETSGGKDIKEVYHKELQYAKARVDNDFNTLYSFQHPDYTAIIDMDRFKSSGGTIQLDYSSVTEKNPNPRIYAPFRQIHFILHDIKVEKTYIDKNMRYAKFHTVHIMNIFLPMAKGMPIRREMKSIDYWEKLNGEWFFLNKVRPEIFTHISGNTTKYLSLPEVKAEYIEVPVNEIESEHNKK